MDRFGAWKSWKSRTAPWGLAAAAACVALVGRALLDPLLSDNDPYVPLFAAVAFSAWYLGPGPAAFTTLLGSLGTVFWFIDPRGSLAIADRADAFGVGVFIIVSGAIIFFGQRARQTAAQLRQAEQTLENRVRERTAELVVANERLHELSARIMNTQDQERRYIARELHDSVGQILASMAMNQDLIHQGGSDNVAKATADNEKLLQQAIQEVRTISHLLHPPLLDEVGLRSALGSFVRGFSERSGVATSLEVPVDMGRLPPDLEISIFRIVQECLTNIHKHSRAKTASIRLEPRDGEITVTVKDDGIGIPEQQASGMGLGGMRERVRRLGGAFQVQSSSAGTTVTAPFPVSGPNDGSRKIC